jgi:hypothetical protein
VLEEAVGNAEAVELAKLQELQPCLVALAKSMPANGALPLLCSCRPAATHAGVEVTQHQREVHAWDAVQQPLQAGKKLFALCRFAASGGVSHNDGKVDGAGEARPQKPAVDRLPSREALVLGLAQEQAGALATTVGAGRARPKDGVSVTNMHAIFPRPGAHQAAYPHAAADEPGPQFILQTGIPRDRPLKVPKAEMAKVLCVKERK